MIFDIVCLVIALGGLFLGYRRGLLAQVGSIFGVILGIVCCQVLGSTVSLHFIDEGDSLDTILLTTILTYVLLFACAYLSGRFVGNIVARLLTTMNLGWFNKVGGAIFTMFEYLLVYSLLINAFIGAFPNSELRSDYEGVKKFVIDLGPDVLGSTTITEIYSKVGDIVSEGANSLIDGNSTTKE